MNPERAVVVGWAEPLESGQQIQLQELETKIGGLPLWINEAGEQAQAAVDNLRFLLRVQLPEQNGLIEYSEATDSMQVLKETVNSPPSQLLTPQEWLLDTENVSPQKQQEMTETEDVEGELDEEDEDEELVDKTFKIYRRVDFGSPGHVMRYCLSDKTTPLFYSDYDQFDVKAVPNCQYCGSKRVFEFQLGCQLLATVKQLLHLDWGIVAVYTCSASCDSKLAKSPSANFFSLEHVELQLSPDEIDSHNFRIARERKIREFQQDMEDGDGEVPTEEELKRIAAQIKAEEALAQSEALKSKQSANTQAQQGVDEMDTPKTQPPKKLFEDEEDDDDNWG